MAHHTSATQQTFTHWGQLQPTKDSVIPRTKVNDLEDKTLEELVLSDLYYDIARNLPPDDVLTYMHQDNLVTDGQRDNYRMMKANNLPEVERSEYLLECLKKGEAGFLKRLCTILRQIPPSSYIADKIEEKQVQLAMQQTTIKSPARTDRTKKSKVENTYWMAEYKKLDSKTRMQLRAKEREIKRLRNAIQQLERENNNNLQRLLRDMRCQVDNVSKWIDNKTETVPQCSALVNMALSKDGKVDDIFTGTSESSSNQSTLERPPKHHPKRKESTKSHTPNSAPSTNSKIKDKSPASHQQAYSDSLLQPFRENVSNPPTAIESDASDITRPLQVSEFTVIGIDSSQSILENSVHYPTKLVLHNGIQDKEHCQLVDFGTTPAESIHNHTALPTAAVSMNITGETPASIDTGGLQPVSGPNTPSTIKSNTVSPTLSLSTQGQGRASAKVQKPIKVFKFGKERSPPSDQESIADFREVFKRIRGKEPPTK